MAVKNAHHEATFDFPIKSIIPGQDDQLLLIETTDVATKTQTFLLLSFELLEIIQAISFDETYHGMVLKSYDKSQLLFIQYSDQNNPDKTNIYTFSWDGGDPTFAMMNTRIIQSGLDWIKVPHPHFTNKEIYIDLKSGTEIKKEEPREHSTLLPSIIYATAYPDSSEYFTWFVQYFQKHNIVPCRQIEYLKTVNHALISYYEEKQNGLSNTLVILEADGTIKEQILLEDQLPGIGKDTFFIFRNKAIFVTQKSTLNIYDL
ncbi:hypothetical protein N7E81_12195 [Reichenbachiella carrageenanivorans]|uniref:DUF4905 domain-containing protein n=1 Tax=Reichenbachiella carrageenanivorans TaxID=2979869 RepID=A0ABY6CW27_9BACT|nr:hypothetical protein [Reichenbachiella carrageenanivorans]UXX78119.1 hypothetical protein N7E81_12195 [Reichenbachiella carrageenanivorans]